MLNNNFINTCTIYSNNMLYKKHKENMEAINNSNSITHNYIISNNYASIIKLRHNNLKNNKIFITKCLIKSKK